MCKGLPAGVLAVLALTPAASGAAEQDWTRGGPWGGGVLALVSDPAQPGQIYAGADGPAVFSSADAGTTWQSSDTALPGPVEGLAVGNAAVYAGVSYEGVWRSRDGGQTWTATGDGLPTSFSYVIGLATDGSAIYVGTAENGVWRSSDDGASWQQAAGGIEGEAIVAVHVDPQDGEHVVADTIDGRSFETTDGGADWAPAGVLDQGWMVDGPQLAVDPSDDQHRWRLLSDGSLEQSHDGGATWQPDGDGPPAPDPTAIEDDTDGLYLATLSDGVWRSGDGGATWTAASTGIDLVSVADVAAGPGAGRLVAATRNGIYRSQDGGSSWMPVPATRGLATDSATRDLTDGDTFYVGGDGSAWRTRDGGAHWISLPVPWDGVTREIAVDPLAPATIWAAVTGDGVQTAGGIYRSRDRGGHWTQVDTRDSSWIGVAADSGRSLYALVGDSLLRSRSGGASWDDVSPGDHLRQAVLDPLAPATVHVVARGGLYRSEDGGDSWDLVHSGAPMISSLAVDPADGSLAGGRTHAGDLRPQVFRSSDGGATWDRVHGSFPAQAPLNGLTVGPDGALHAATGRGVFDLAPAAAHAILGPPPRPAFVTGSTVTAAGIPVVVSWGVPAGCSAEPVLWLGGEQVGAGDAGPSSLHLPMHPGGHAAQVGARPAGCNDGTVGGWRLGPAFAAHAFQEGYPAAAWSGGWSTVADAAADGGRTRVTTARGARVAFRVTARAVAWEASLRPSGGTAHVYVDGRLADVVSLAGQTVHDRHVVFTHAWAQAGLHTVTIVADGTPRHPRVDVDALLTLS